MLSTIKRIRMICKEIIIRFFKDRLLYSASALTFTTLLALVPLMTISILIASAFPIFHSIRDQTQQFIFHNFIPASSAVIQQYLQAFAKQAGQLSWMGTIILIITAIMMILTIETALNNIWHVKRRRYHLGTLLRYWAVLSLAPLLFALSIAATSHVISLPLVVGTATSLGIKKIVFSSAPFILTLTAFTLLYVIVPNCKVPIRHGLISAIIATILFGLIRKSFVLYITHVPMYRLIYGALAAVPIFLIWIYLLWVIILFGALISNVLSTNYFERKIGFLNGFTHAFMWLGFIWQAQQAGKALSLSQLHRLLPGNYEIEVSVVLSHLLNTGLIQATRQNEYVLIRDFSQMTLANLYEILPWKLSATENSALFTGKIKKALDKSNKALSKNLDVSLKDIYQDLFDV